MPFSHLVALAILGTVDGTLNFRGSGSFSEEQVSAVFSSEATDSEHLEIPETLKEIFVSLPKDSSGRVGHDTIRYALNRYFEHRHGWRLRGLDPRQSSFQQVGNVSGFIKEWVPAFLQREMEKRDGKGADLHGLAALIASVEDLVSQETRAHLKDLYEFFGRNPQETLTTAEAGDIFEVYAIQYLTGEGFVSENMTQLRYQEVVWKKKSADAQRGVRFMHKVMDPYLAKSEGFRLEDLAMAADDFGKQAAEFNKVECHILRNTLQNMESKKAGRVRLSVFYNKSKTSKWFFDDKVEYLRGVGALDEVDPTAVSVIIPNFVLSRPNCIDATNLYSACCENICEPLMREIEAAVGGPMSSVPQIIKVVQRLSSRSYGSRALSQTLIDRLMDLASLHEDQVPIHSRLFSEWMHHAFPLDCPYPTEATKMEFSAEEVMAMSGGLTEEEMQSLVQADTCAVSADGRIECHGETEDLPWSGTQELLSSHHYTQHLQRSKTTSLGSLLWLLAFGLAFAIVAPSLASRGPKRNQKVRVLVAVLILLSAGLYTEFVDPRFFGIALVVAFVMQGDVLRRAISGTPKVAKFI